MIRQNIPTQRMRINSPPTSMSCDQAPMIYITTYNKVTILARIEPLAWHCCIIHAENIVCCTFFELHEFLAKKRLRNIVMEDIYPQEMVVSILLEWKVPVVIDITL